MQLTPHALIEFAVQSPDRRWATTDNKRRFTLQSKGNGLLVTYEGGLTRVVSAAEIRKFCEGFAAGGRTKKTVGDGFSTSYLFPPANEWFDLTTRLRRFEILPLADEVPDAKYCEGATRSVVVNWYERSPDARRACISAHGTKCVVCGFDFGAAYGKEAEGVIHVHHLNPLALSQGEHTVDPVRDLRPVCPNCHAVIHLGGVCRTIDEVRAMLNQRQGR